MTTPKQAFEKWLVEQHWAVDYNERHVEMIRRAFNAGIDHGRKYERDNAKEKK